MASIIDERGFNQGFKLNHAQQIRLLRRAQAIVAEMRLPDSIEERRKINILELGCGTGELAYHIAKLTGASVTGVDLSHKFINYAKEKHDYTGLRFVVMDLSKEAPVSSMDQYQYIVGNGILHHLYHHLESFIPALARWLARDGRLIFWEPNLCNPYVFFIFSFSWLRRLARLEPDEMAFTSTHIKQLLIGAGFEDIKVETRDFLLPNTPNFMITTVIRVGGKLEKIPFVRRWAQSLFLSAKYRP